MTKDKNTSSLGQHVFEKKGIVSTPFNHALRDSLRFTSWSKDRLPDYLWLGLILNKYGRAEAFSRLGTMLQEISDLSFGLTRPRHSDILKLSEEQQSAVYKCILDHVSKDVLAPLTIILSENRFPYFYRTFLVPTMKVEERLEILRTNIRTIYNHQSSEATDLRYLAVSYMLLEGRIQFSAAVTNTIEAFTEYHKTQHSDEKMKSYRPAIRSAEAADFEGTDYSFSEFFWTEVGMIDECELFIIGHEAGARDYENLLLDSRKAIDYLCASEKLLLLESDKFSVCTGSASYALKSFEEIEKGNLGNSVLGRHGVRTIAEVLVMLKYILKNEAEKPQIWSDYKKYGISKLKLVLLKSRELPTKEASHVVEPIIDVLVNEQTWEEFIDIDLKYFDQLNIREKCTLVGEKQTYDILYDYDSGFVHGLWGAIRECSMLACNNPTHRFHSTPDVHNSQKLPSVVSDTEKLILKLMRTLHSIYPFPAWYVDTYISAETPSE